MILSQSRQMRVKKGVRERESTALNQTAEGANSTCLCFVLFSLGHDSSFCTILCRSTLSLSVRLFTLSLSVFIQCFRIKQLKCSDLGFFDFQFCVICVLYCSEVNVSPVTFTLSLRLYLYNCLCHIHILLRHICASACVCVSVHLTPGTAASCNSY